MQSRLLAVKAVQVADQVLHAGMARVIEQRPGQFAVVVPFVRLCELLTHEQQLLARMPPHEAEVGAQVGVFLPVVAGHLGQQRAFAVHHFVVRQRQHEILAERIHQAEGDLVVVPAPVHRIFMHVLQRIVHPAHVPFVMEAQAAVVHRRASRRERRSIPRPR